MRSTNSEIRVCVISSGRPQAPEHPIYRKLSDHHNVVWYTGPDDIDYKIPRYQKQVHVPPSENNLVAARNAALDDCQESDTYCMMLDDDLKRVGIMTPTSSRPVPVEPTHAIEEMHQILRDTPGIHMAAAPPTPNPQNYRPEKPIRLRHVCISSWVMVKPGTAVRYDPVFKLKEDYDYTLQHIQRHGGVLRLEWILPTFTHRTNAGGAVSYRTPRLEILTIRQLQRKWGADVVRQRKAKPLEIMLNVPAWRRNAN